MDERRARKIEAAKAEIALLEEGLAMLGAADIEATEKRLMEIAEHADDPAIFTVCTSHMSGLKSVRDVFNLSLARYRATIKAMSA